jgi:hypothetical protein
MEEYPCPLSESKVKTHSIPFKSSVTHVLVAREKVSVAENGRKICDLEEPGK